MRAKTLSLVCCCIIMSDQRVECYCSLTSLTWKGITCQHMSNSIRTSSGPAQDASALSFPPGKGSVLERRREGSTRDLLGATSVACA